MSGWWLGTWISWFSIILGIILPFDFHVFQRGWNHQPVNILSTTWKITMFELPSRFKKNQRWPIKSHKKVPKSTCEVRPRDPSRSLPPHAGLMWTKWAQTSGSQRQSGPLYMNIMKTSPLDECNECNQTYWWKITTWAAAQMHSRRQKPRDLIHSSKLHPSCTPHIIFLDSPTAISAVGHCFSGTVGTCTK